MIEAERKALLAWLIILFGAVLFYSTAMHIAEHEAQPEKFGTIPDAMWWAIETVTTVGYGEVIPLTLAGKLIASFAMVTGFLLLGLPVGILATAFAEEIHRREFVVTWTMVAQRAAVSRPRRVRDRRDHALSAGAVHPPGRNDRAQGRSRAIRCISSPRARSRSILRAENVKLGEGQFFGEIAVLRKTSRTAPCAPLRLRNC